MIVHGRVDMGDMGVEGGWSSGSFEMSAGHGHLMAAALSMFFPYLMHALLLLHLHHSVYS